MTTTANMNIGGIFCMSVVSIKAKVLDKMADSDLICNFRKCRKRLTTFGWVEFSLLVAYYT